MTAMNRSLPVLGGMREQWAEVSGGRLRYLVGGSGPPLVLVHGIAASPFSFRFNCDALMSSFQLYLLDLISPGCFRDGNGMGNSLARIAARVGEFLDTEVMEQAHILGSSHGGALVMELAGIAPERLRSMVLVSPANPFASHYRAVVNFYLSTWGRMFMRIAPYLPGRAWDYGIGRMYAHPGRMSQGTGIGYARALRQRGTTEYILNCLETFAEDVEGLRAKLPLISRIPTVLIWGDYDSVVELSSSYSLQEALQAELIVMKGVGHLPYEEDPEEFNRIVVEYLMKN